MVPGGITEIICHFAGYLRLPLEPARAWINYDEMAPPAKLTVDFDALQQGGLPPVEFDDLSSAPINITIDLTEDPFRANLLKLFKVQGPAMPTAPKYLPAAPPAPLFPPLKAGGAAADSYVPYGRGANDVVLEVRQYNLLFDNDVYGPSAESDLNGLQRIDVLAKLEDMLARAGQQAPDNLPPAPADALALLGGSGGQDVALSLLEALKTNTAHGDQSLRPGQTTQVGQDVTAVGQDDAPALDAIVAPFTDGSLLLMPVAAFSDLQAFASQGAQAGAQWAGPASGQFASLGSNHAVNGALIYDARGWNAFTLVKGDYVQTNAIVQVNVLFDENFIATVGSPANVLTSGDTATNTAHFLQLEIGAPFGNGSGHVSYDVSLVEGNYYDINAIIQTNYLIDNDVLAQTATAKHLVAVLGNNSQANLVVLQSTDMHYDIIVIGGNYYNANLIYQTNVVLNHDIVYTIDAGAGPDAGVQQTVAVGENTLTNTATIAAYGDNTFGAWSDIASLYDAIVNYKDITGWLESIFSASDITPGNVNILYVTGDYYNVNLIAQTNAVADADTALQYFPGAIAADVSQSSVPNAETGVVQRASTGGNAATNAAIIIDVNTAGTQFVGGHHYDDATLVQTNIMTNDSTVMHGDTTTLAPEVIAFLDTLDANSDASHGGSLPPPHADDVLGSGLH